MDKLTSRVTKIQSDTQLRFSDLENNDVKINNKESKKAKCSALASPKTLEQHQDIRQATLPKNKRQFGRNNCTNSYNIRDR